MATTRAREPTATTKQLAAVGGGGRQGKEDIKKKEMGKPSDQLLRRPLASVPPHQATGGQQPQPKKKETKPTDKESSLNPLAPPLPSAPTIISAIKEEVLEKALTIPIDPQEAEDVFQCPEYVHDIYRHMVESEQKPCYAVSGCSFVDRFSSITTEHRSILVDWLIQVHLKFKLLQETLYIAVDILDRYLDLQKIPKEQLQLTGVTSMFLASKYEEIYPPSIFDFSFICADTYTDEQIREKERNILISLSYDLNKPFTLQFLRRYSKVTNSTMKEHSMAKYILELSLLDWKLSTVRPSMKAAAALLLSKHILSRSTVDCSDLLEYASLTLEDLKETMTRLKGCMTFYHRHKLSTVRRKYEMSRFMEIAKTSELERRLQGQSSQ